MDITPEVLVAYAAGHLRPAAAERVAAAVAQDANLELELEGVRALVKDLGARGALEYLEEVADRLSLKHASAQSEMKSARRWMLPLAIGLVASVAAVVYFAMGGPAQAPDELALAIVSSEPDLQLVRDALPPAWAVHYDKGDFVAAETELRASGLANQQECFMLGIVLLRQPAAWQDSSLSYLVKAAAMPGDLKDQAWLYAGALAYRMGRREAALDYLKRTQDARAVELRERL